MVEYKEASQTVEPRGQGDFFFIIWWDYMNVIYYEYLSNNQVFDLNICYQ